MRGTGTDAHDVLPREARFIAERPEDAVFLVEQIQRRVELGNVPVVHDEHAVVIHYAMCQLFADGTDWYVDIPMVFSRCAMQRSVDDANSVWMVRCSFASVSTSTLLVASSCKTLINYPPLILRSLGVPRQ